MQYLFYFGLICSCALNLIDYFIVTMQDNSVDCGVFTWRYAYGLYLLREQSFNSRSARLEITNSATFQFNLEDIARIRLEMTTLLVNLEQQYAAFKGMQDEI